MRSSRFHSVITVTVILLNSSSGFARALQVHKGFRAQVRDTVSESGQRSGTSSPIGVTSFKATALELGNEVTVEGYIMDRFCIDRGTLLDKPRYVTLKNPEQHSVHCLIDVRECRESGYEVLFPPPQGSDTYIRAYRLDENGNNLVLSQGKEDGICTDCVGTGTILRGYRANITGTISAPGQSDGTPPTLAVTSLVTSGGEEGEKDNEDEEDLGKNTVRLDDKTILKYELNDVKDAVTFTMTHQGTGWLGLGFGSMMIGSDAIIGLPGVDISKTNPGKYHMEDLDLGGVNLVADERQTIINGSLTQKNGVTVMMFARLLNESGEVLLLPEGSNDFIFAYGMDNFLGFHANRGAFKLDFTAGAEELVINDYYALWRAHGACAFAAWGVLTPIAVAASLLQAFVFPEKLNGALWFQIHRAFNSLTFALTVVAFALAVSGYQQTGRAHFNAAHQIAGLVIFIAVTLQVLGGIFRPHAPPKEGAGQGQGGPHKKTQTRFVWEVLHKSMGYGILAVGFWQIQSGIKLFGNRYGLDNNIIPLNAYWGWIGAFLGVVSLLKIYDVLRIEDF